MINLRRHTNDNALLAYVDLCGTKNFYKQNIESIKEQADWLFKALLETFSEEFYDEFSKELPKNFYVNIYADSIIICERISTEKIIERLVKFLLSFQYRLFPIPSRALVSRKPFFSWHMEAAEDSSILAAKFTSISLCGGKGIISSDEMLRGLPVGVYMSKNLIDKLDKGQQKRMLKVKNEDLYFVKQNIDTDSLFSNLDSEDLDECWHMQGSELESCLWEKMEARWKKTLIDDQSGNYADDKDIKDKWEPWILAHAGKISEIKKQQS